MVKLQVNCKHCRSDIKILTGGETEESIVGRNYHCTLNKMENNECPGNCEWFIPDKVYVV
ncbi:MAG TPA: hypothetical protein EYP23_01905 [Thermoplasmata archaeon]|nr:hypothetical protein [Thermoplasmata archaeon]